MDIQHEEHGHKGSFFIEKDGQRAGEMTYSRAGEKLVIIDHTEVADALRGTGAGKQLVLAGVKWARETGTKLIPMCPYARSVIERDPSLRDVVA